MNVRPYYSEISRKFLLFFMRAFFAYCLQPPEDYTMRLLTSASTHVESIIMQIALSLRGLEHSKCTEYFSQLLVVKPAQLKRQNSRHWSGMFHKSKRYFYLNYPNLASISTRIFESSWLFISITLSNEPTTKRNHYMVRASSSFEVNLTPNTFNFNN